MLHEASGKGDDFIKNTKAESSIGCFAVAFAFILVLLAIARTKMSGDLPKPEPWIKDSEWSCNILD
jgi:hypothetical protein